MALEAWNDLTLTEKQKIRRGFIRNPHKAYERLRSQAEEGNDAPEPTPTTHNLNFVVIDGSNPIQGATVTIGNISSTTGSAGGCTFNGIEAGEVEVTVSAEGYATVTENITVGSESTSFTISLTAVNVVPLQLHFINSDEEEEAPLEGVTATLTRITHYENGQYTELEIPENCTVISDENGECTLSIPIPTQYDLSHVSFGVLCSKEGYTDGLTSCRWLQYDENPIDLYMWSE